MSDRKLENTIGKLAGSATASERATCSQAKSRESSPALPLLALAILVWCQLSAVGLGESVPEQREAMQEREQLTARATPKPDEPFWREMERAIEARFKDRTLVQPVPRSNDTDLQIVRVTAKPGHWTFMLNNVTRIRKELRDVRPGDDVSAALFKNWEPRWMDSCDKRDPEERVTIWIGPEYQKRFSLKEWEKKVNYRVVLQAPRMNDTQLARTKRAISSARGHEDENQSRQEYGFGGDEKSAILFKGGKKYPRLAAKKTTFKMSSRASAKHRHHKHAPRAENRFLVAQPGNSPLGLAGLASSAPAAAPSSFDSSKSAALALTKATRSVIASDIWVSFQISAIDSALASLRVLQSNLTQAIVNETRSLGAEWPEVSSERGAEIAGALDEWLPDWRTLVAADDTPSIFPNITGGIYVANRHVILANTSDYLQLFQVALEQMRYDHENLERDKNTLDAVRQLDKQLSRLQCFILGLRDAVKDFHDSRRAFVALHSDSVALSDIDDKEVAVKRYLEQYRSGNLPPRERPLDSRLEIESAKLRAFERLTGAEQKKVLDKMNFFLPENRPPDHVDSDHEAELPLESQKPRTIVKRLARPTHVWREVMPLQQRQMYNQRERAIRDQAMLRKLPPAILSVQSLMDFQWKD